MTINCLAYINPNSLECTVEIPKYLQSVNDEEKKKTIDRLEIPSICFDIKCENVDYFCQVLTHQFER